MQYCEKCRRACHDGAASCPACRSRKLRPAGGGDLVFLCRCELYTAQLLNDALQDAGILYRLESAGNAYFSFDSETMPTDQNVFVQLDSLEPAQELAAQVCRQVEQERGGEGGPPAGPPSKKRIVGEIVSVVAFLVLIMLAVYGADGLANWLKSLLGMG